jgi:hypothetical protein
MRNPIEYIINIINSEEKETLTKYFIIFLVLLFSSLFLCNFLFLLKKKSLEKEYASIIKKKNETSLLIDNKHHTIQKKKYIDTLLEENRSFRLKDYVYSLFSQHNLISHLASKNESINEQKIKKNYLELQMTIEVVDLSTAQMLQILSFLESDFRVYIKTITVKNAATKKLSLQVTLAALQLLPEYNIT